MSDREALAAALERTDMGRLHKPTSYSDQTWDDLREVHAAARERRDQLPEKCPNCEGLSWGRGPIPCALCHGSGKVYPTELVERIAWTICDAEYQEPMWRFLTPEGQRRYMRLAVAVLDALNGETR